jgi:hypothetical protein
MRRSCYARVYNVDMQSHQTKEHQMNDTTDHLAEANALVDAALGLQDMGRHDEAEAKLAEADALLQAEEAELDAAGVPQLPVFEISVLASGDTAEADDLDAALVAADTLVRDYADNGRGRGALDLGRRSVIILRDGKHDGIAANLARTGARRSPASEWSRRV